MDYSTKGIKKAPSILISSILFLSLIIEWISLKKTDKYRWLAQIKMQYGKLRKYSLRIGLVNCFTSTTAAIIDVMLLFAVVITIIVNLFFSKNGFVVSTSVAFLAFLIQVHSILNGKIYIDLKLLEKRKMQNE